MKRLALTLKTDHIPLDGDSSLVASYGLVEDSLQTFYDFIGCSLIDIPQRPVGGLPLSFVVDDEGLLADDPQISVAFLRYGKVLEVFVGNVLIFGPPDGEGNFTDLPEDVAAYLLTHLVPTLGHDDVHRYVLCIPTKSDIEPIPDFSKGVH